MQRWFLKLQISGWQDCLDRMKHKAALAELWELMDIWLPNMFSMDNSQ
ncbi:hypothetical protein E1A91_D09G085700v1 [Gossypium mustelinum]|uniref:Uncharacterized protein n=1 Tax=Gossypium mustelinum TaxID=34275 RepID=A0A5D2TG67_GOSMU|nr:hypothetical protein E1A91_D09G085700v1 [Gossypium mustelinum]